MLALLIARDLQELGPNLGRFIDVLLALHVLAVVSEPHRTAPLCSLIHGCCMSQGYWVISTCREVRKFPKGKWVE